MKNSSKKSLEKRGVIVAGRSASVPTAKTHQDKRRPQRSKQKQDLKRQIQTETARTRGPFAICENLCNSIGILPVPQS